MIPYVRQEKIIEILANKELIKIEELQKFIPEVSISTLRRDLKELENVNKVQILSGGAVKICSSVSELPMATKSSLQTKEKHYIAELAAREVSVGETIYLDSGSTCTVLLKELLKKDIRIITTNTDVLRLTGNFDAEITILGGTYDPKISSLSGPLTEANIKKYVFDKAFLGANGIDLKFGVTTPNLVEATKKKTVIDYTKEAFLLCDSSKFHKTSAVKSFDLNEVVLITDKLDSELSKKMKIIAR
ncbi:DeoR/GlpR transcriptional regulator [Carnobacterium maltaromaticum]|uniref:DeoR/GlpR family DNA-binding transcription regulator n=1 Tax=Carnobacterium maltaromaticum TaxID=2751 RepID=A0AAW9KA37_CARML|nr:DeoR/GlpR family DNA-binding transcription regulator [Carnobacterium maltaromaticum]KRN74200.1 HTH-type transcriptional regulator FruR [Carnobacterium maltaromaticum]KRN87692.1 HTH-type transcriptional regulator FruR [Carnobacterium maltaromaticum]MBC9788137.1 DeoR family transcriptional regulator [Carnobacterium maltaromaticum]MBC9809167.1 DeoR family transcriptional regulator [Carnobacterium maltaromaticum]MDT1944766.1 DeoR/GlpR family DNA-binding transcription regulator [Carnobacterium m